MRNTFLAFAAALSLGIALMTSAAVAAPHGHFGGWHGGGWHRGGGWGPGLYAFGGPGYGCWVRRWVPTPFGPRWRLVNVCY